MGLCRVVLVLVVLVVDPDSRTWTWTWSRNTKYIDRKKAVLGHTLTKAEGFYQGQGHGFRGLLVVPDLHAANSFTGNKRPNYLVKSWQLPDDILYGACHFDWMVNCWGGRPSYQIFKMALSAKELASLLKWVYCVVFIVFNVQITFNWLWF